MAEIEDELKSLWCGWKRKMKKANLKLNWKNQDDGIQFHHFTAKRRGKVESGTDFLFLGSKMTSMLQSMRSQRVEQDWVTEQAKLKKL